MTLSKRLKALRAERGCTSTWLARQCGVPAVVIREIESGRRANCPIETLWKLADGFKVSVDYLIGRTETRN